MMKSVSRIVINHNCVCKTGEYTSYNLHVCYSCLMVKNSKTITENYNIINDNTKQYNDKTTKSFHKTG